MKLRCVWRLPFLAGLITAAACSTPISFEPQVEDEVELDGGNPVDANFRDGEAGVGDAGRESGAPPPASNCELYPAANCPAAQPRNNMRCADGQQSSSSFCYYSAQAEGQIQVAQCGLDSRWNVSSARCSYRCATALPQGGNFFSLLTDGCARRPLRDCRTALARTSQEGVDRFLSDAVSGCRLPANFRLGVTFDAQGCADWVHYQAMSRLTPAQNQCLSDQLEAVRFDCDVSCAIHPNAAP